MRASHLLRHTKGHLLVVALQELPQVDLLALGLRCRRLNRLWCGRVPEIQAGTRCDGAGRRERGRRCGGHATESAARRSHARLVLALGVRVGDEHACRCSASPALASSSAAAAAALPPPPPRRAARRRSPRARAATATVYSALSLILSQQGSAHLVFSHFRWRAAQLEGNHSGRAPAQGYVSDTVFAFSTRRAGERAGIRLQGPWKF